MSIKELKKCLLTAGHNLSTEDVTNLYSRHIMTLEKLPVDVLVEVFRNLPYRSIQHFCASSKSIKEKCLSSKLSTVIQERKMLTYVGGVKRPITSRKVMNSLLEMIFEPTDLLTFNKGGDNKYKLLIPLVSTDGEVVPAGKVITANWEYEFEAGRVELMLRETLLRSKRKKTVHRYEVFINTDDSSFIIEELAPELSIPISGKSSKSQTLAILKYFFGDKVTSDIKTWTDLKSDDLINPLPFSHDQGKLDVEVLTEKGERELVTVIIRGSTRFMGLIFVREDGKMTLKDSSTEEITKPLFGIESKDEDEDESEDEYPR